MAQGGYIGVDGKARSIAAGYVGVNGVARQIQAGYAGVNGVARQFFSAGTKIGDIPVGDTITFNVNGVPYDFIIVHQGLPSSMYDSSCNGTWLLMKNIYERRQWHSSNSNSYKASTIHSYLNSTFLTLLDGDIQSSIKQVKIPYVNGTGGSAVASGANGLNTRIFLLGGYEIGWTQSTHSGFPIDGACLSYFNGATNSDHVAYLNGAAATWWLRSVNNSSTQVTWLVHTSGGIGSSASSVASGIRPAFVLDRNFKISD